MKKINSLFIRLPILLLALSGLVSLAVAGAFPTDVYSWGNVRSINQPVRSISSSYYKSIALLEDSSVVEWGEDPYSSYRAAVLPEGLHSVVTVAAGYNFGLALKSDGTVVGWGDSASFSSDLVPSAGVTVPAGLSGVIDIAAGSQCAYALKNDGSVVGWGGADDACADSIPGGLSGVTQIDGFQTRFAALKSDGSIVQWGVLGVDTVVPSTHDAAVVRVGGFGLALMKDSTVQVWGSLAPEVPEGLKHVVAVSAGSTHGLAVLADGSVVPLGVASASYGETTIPDSLRNVRISGAEAGINSSFLIGADGRVFSWGDNYFGRTKPPLAMEGIAMVAAGNYTDVIFVMNDSSTVQYWGSPTNGAEPPSNMTGIRQIAMGNSFDLALDASGKVRGWGAATNSRLAKIDTLTSVQALDAGTYGIVLRGNGTVTAWGDYAKIAASSLASLTDVRAVAATDGAFFALLSDSTVVGRVVTGYSASYATVPEGLTGVVSLSGGGSHALALKADGTVVTLGIVGDNEPPAGLSDVVAVAAGKHHSLALKADGSVVAWGDDSYGQTDVPANLPPVRAIAAGDYSSVVLFENAWTESIPFVSRKRSFGRSWRGDATLKYDLHGRSVSAKDPISSGAYISGDGKVRVRR